MQAITYQHYGPPDILEYHDIATPMPAAGEVLIRIRAASVNPYDWHFLRGAPRFIRLFTGIGKPKSPRLGADVAGTVEAVGPNVTQFKPGDAVFGVCEGSFAERACGKEAKLALKPEPITFDQAAAVPIAGITALQGLRDVAHVQAGQSVLINGAAGGVGTFAVQIAKWLGARVTGVCSTRNLEMVQSLGADHAIDYTCEDFVRCGEQYDVLFDLIGNRSLSEIRQVLKPQGSLVACGGGGPDRSSADLFRWMLSRMLAGPFVSQKLLGVFAKVNTADLTTLADLMATGKLHSVLDRSYPLPQTADAIRYVEQCHVRGKVTIAIP